MSANFKRQLGAESGVQLNPLRDNSEVPSFGNSDQVFGIMMRATRGRIDKPFKVDRGNVPRKLGKGELIRASALNEAYVHVVEALNSGAYEAVVQRLITNAAVNKWAVVTAPTDTPAFATSHTPAVLVAVVNAGAITSVTVTSGGKDYAGTETIAVGGPGNGAVLTPVFSNGVITSVTVTSGGTGYTTAPTLTCLPVASSPLGSYLFAVKHLGCFNDGIVVEFRADEKKSSGVAVANDRITVRIKDKDGVLINEFYGSLNPDAKDDFGGSLYLPDVVSGMTDEVIVSVGVTGASADVEPTSDAYGYNSNGQEKWAKSSALICFIEGGTAYSTDDYVSARQKLQYTPFDYSYISSGGSQSAALLGQLAQLAFDTNRQLRFDIPGNLTPSAAIAFVEQLNMGASPTAHLLHAFWSPLQSSDPAGINPNGYFGAATLNIAMSCLRNAQTNVKGFAPKNYPIAGRAWPVRRAKMVQTYTPNDQELNALARAKINPVLWETFSGGGAYVYRDQLTSALVDVSLKALISVADMSASIDDFVTRAGKDVLHLPMEIAIKRLRRTLSDLFEGAESSDWLVPSDEPDMDGKAWKFEVKANEIRPFESIDVNYWLRYDGAVRKIFVTQTLTR